MTPPLTRALAEKNYNDPTPVQTAVLEPQVMEADLLVSAQTGSGKTVAYGLALANTILGDAEVLGRAGDPLALIVAPTRELALQVHTELTWLYRYTGARVTFCVGGMDPSHERRQLASGVHIVVGTPGRLRDHLERGNLKVSNLKAVVLDEADEMLDLGFREDLEFILETTPKERRTLLFSATLPRGIVTLAKQYQNDATRIDVSGAQRAHTDIEYRAIRVATHDVGHAVVNLLRFFEAPSTLVFCNTRDSVRHMHATLLERGFPTVSLSGELSQAERNRTMLALRSGRAQICVATDVAARGIDLPGLDLVIHAELPNDPEVLQHRSGRTGRAGRKGVSVMLVTPPNRFRAERLLSGGRINAAWSGPPTADEIKKRDDERMLQDTMLTEEGGEEDLAAAKALLAVRSAEEVAKAFIRLYRSQKPAPEDLIDPGMGARDRRPARNDGKREPAAAAPGRRPERGERPEREREPSPRASAPVSHGPGNSVWFRLNVGRQKKADPKWLLPEICRQGKVTKPDIGAIRIFDDETRFEINEDAAGRFAEAIRSAKGSEIRIEPSTKPDMNAPERRKALAEEGPREKAEIPDPNAKYKKRKPFGSKPYAAKPGAGGGKPHGGKPVRHRDHGAKDGKPARRRP